jgi:3-polyprenyl-4-hydroxybenzoate decarboxylase
MTYNDLLEAVKSPTFMNSRTLETPYIALRAVLELHKPNDFGNCTACGLSPTNTLVIYPCKTIKSIEKELS